MEVSNPWGHLQIIQVMNAHDLVLKPMVTWGSPMTFWKPPISPLIIIIINHD